MVIFPWIFCSLHNLLWFSDILVAFFHIFGFNLLVHWLILLIIDFFDWSIPILCIEFTTFVAEFEASSNFYFFTFIISILLEDQLLLLKGYNLRLLGYVDKHNLLVRPCYVCDFRFDNGNWCPLKLSNWKMQKCLPDGND